MTASLRTWLRRTIISLQTRLSLPWRLFGLPFAQIVLSKRLRWSPRRVFVSTPKSQRTSRPIRKSSTATSASDTKYLKSSSASGPAANLRTVRGAVQMPENVNFSASEPSLSATCNVTSTILLNLPMQFRTTRSAIRGKIIDLSAPSSVRPNAVWDSLPSIDFISNKQTFLACGVITRAKDFSLFVQAANVCTSCIYARVIRACLVAARFSLTVEWERSFCVQGMCCTSARNRELILPNYVGTDKLEAAGHC